MPSLPPLECLRFFEAAARRESFVLAAKELGVTPPAVAYRVKMLEDHVGLALFDRASRGIALNPRGKACLADVQRILTEIGNLIDRCRNGAKVQRLNIVVVESIADRWLMPKVPGFTASHPHVAIKFETDHLRVDPNRDDFDLWISYAGETTGPSPEATRHEILFEEPMFPVCSPALLETLGRPHSPADLHSWPLLYHLGWPSDWSHWFASHGASPPDLSRASGFRLCSMLLRATVERMGVAIGRASIIAPELQQGTLVPSSSGTARHAPAAASSRPPPQGAGPRSRRSGNGSFSRPPTNAPTARLAAADPNPPPCRRARHPESSWSRPPRSRRSGGLLVECCWN